MRRQGYQDGYNRRPLKSEDPIYKQAYRRGSEAWAADEKMRLEEQAELDS